MAEQWQSPNDSDERNRTDDEQIRGDVEQEEDFDEDDELDDEEDDETTF